MSQHILRSNDLCSSSIDPVRRDVSLVSSGVYGLDDLSGYGVRSEPIPHGLAAGISTRSYPSSLEDPVVASQRQDLSARISPMPAVNPDLIYERPPSQRRVDGLPVPPGESNILFVDGLPTDCTRREVGREMDRGGLVRERKEGRIQVRGRRGENQGRQEARRNLMSGDKAMVLCFVEFNDSKCALTAMDALQGYKFDDKKPNAPILRIHFAHFPFRLPSELEDQRYGTR